MALGIVIVGLIGATVVGAQKGFDNVVTPLQIWTMFGDWGLNYKGNYGNTAAIAVKADIQEAINMHPSFASFCNSDDPAANIREAAAFFANVRKETGGLSAFEEQSWDTGTYCTSKPQSGASDELKAAGEKYPCTEGKGYHGRGAIQLTWNINYGRFSEFLYNDKNVLLKNPELVVGAGPMGWAATLWFWMTPQDYGGQCPPKVLTGYLTPGTQSCHDAIVNGPGMGKTINIINGGYECCPQSTYRDNAIARIQSYLNFVGILGGTAANPGCSDLANCEIAEGCPLIYQKEANGCPVKGTCTVESKARWLGADKLMVNDWKCPKC